MTTPTLPTVPLPTQTDDDTDDDDDVPTPVISGQPPATTVPGQPTPAVSAPPPAGTGVPGQPPANTPPAQPAPGTVGAGQTPTGAPINSASVVPSGSRTRLADNLPSGSATNSVVPVTPGGESKGLGVGATAGIGVGVALAVILMVLGAWIFVRRRRRRWQRKRTASGSTAHGDTPDEEVARKLSGQEVRAYRAPGGMGAAEMGYGKEYGVDGKHRAELASPVVPVEAVGDREYAVELPGSAVPMREVEKGNGERLFSDAPIDDRNDTFDPESRLADVKR
ncbi:hypothetical protein BKA66DRAFT_148309 [Pyrenochaeta sp. MPI-SDFR-AT-0127]|nr:hypothetical protein BKA66DRAFT_148309 [Pyrenochaeta sp. MPI-SDFR-AT-0127]